MSQPKPPPKQQPLEGIELIDCARANAKHGHQVAAQQCGYGTDLAAFFAALKTAGQAMGIDISELADLLTEQDQFQRLGGLQISPDSVSQL